MSKTTTRIRVLLDWELDSKHAIIWAADKAGLFEKKGLQVEMVDKLPDSLEKVHAGEVELAINYPHNILGMLEKLPNLVSVGAFFKTNPEGLLSLKKSGINTPQDLINKKIAVGWSPLGKSQIKIFLEHHGLTEEDVELVPVTDDGDILLREGKIEVLNWVTWGLPRTERRGFEINFFPYVDSGVPNSAFLVFVGEKTWVKSNQGAVKEFFACLKGGLDLVKQWGEEEWESFTDPIEIRNRDEEMAVWEVTLPLIDDGGVLFHHNIEELKKLQDVLYTSGMLKTTYPIEEIFLNSFIA